MQSKPSNDVITSNLTMNNCLEDLKKNGITSINLYSIINQENINKLYDFAALKIKTSSRVENKSFIRNFVGGNYDSGKILNFNNKDPLLNLALHPFFLFLVKGYLKQDCQLIDITFSETFSTEDKSRKLSQRWHRDPAVRGLIKIFIYFSDVTKNCGPFEYIPKTHNNMNLNPISGPITTKKFGGSFYPDQDKINNKISDKNLQVESMIGSKGKIIICDTTGLHRGGFCKDGSRLMLTLVYYPKGDPWKSRIRVSKENLNLSKFQMSFVK